MNSYSSEMVLKENLHALRLPTMLREYEACQRAATQDGSSYVEYLSTLTTLEVQERNTKRIRRRISEGQFPALKPLESFEMNKAPGLSAHLVRQLAAGTYIEERQNLILLGKSGTGKTHFATALAIEACRQNHRVRFYTACSLVTELLEAREAFHLKQLMDRLKRYDLLILDELGYVPFSKPGAELLFQVLSERYERSSTIITTNLSFPEWVEVFGGATLTGALLDRITHHCQILEFNWASIRFQDSMEQHHGQKEDLKDSQKEGKQQKTDPNNQAAGGTPGT